MKEEQKVKYTNKNATKKLASISLFFLTITILLGIFFSLWFILETQLIEFASDVTNANHPIAKAVNFINSNSIINYAFITFGGLYFFSFIFISSYIAVKRRQSILKKSDVSLMIFAVLFLILVACIPTLKVINDMFIKNNMITNVFAKAISLTTLNEKLLFVILNISYVVLFILFLVIPLCLSYGTTFTKKIKEQEVKNVKKDKLEDKQELSQEKEKQKIEKTEQETNEEEKQIEEKEINEEKEHEEKNAQNELALKYKTHDLALVPEQKEKVISEEEAEEDHKIKIIVASDNTQEMPIVISKLEDNQILEASNDMVKPIVKEEQSLDEIRVKTEEIQVEPQIVYVTQNQVVNSDVDIHEVKIQERQKYLKERYEENQKDLLDGLYQKLDNKKILPSEETKTVYADVINEVKNQEINEELTQQEAQQEEPIIEKKDSYQNEIQNTITQRITLDVDGFEIDKELKEVSFEEPFISIIKHEPLQETPPQEISQEEPKPKRTRKTPTKTTTKKKTAAKKTSTKKTTTTRKRTTKKVDDFDNIVLQRSTIIAPSEEVPKDLDKLLNNDYNEEYPSLVRTVEDKEGTKVPKATAKNRNLTVDELIALEKQKKSQTKKDKIKSKTLGSKTSKSEELAAIKKAKAAKEKLIQAAITKLIESVEDLDDTMDNE